MSRMAPNIDRGIPTHATVSHMDIGVRDLRNHTARVIDAVQAGERVTLTVNGEPVADIEDLADLAGQTLEEL